MRQNRIVGLAAALLTATLLTACGGDDEPTASSEDVPAEDAGAGAAEVTIERSRFEPDEVTVAVGGEVTWENLDAFDHTVTSAEGSDLAFDSGAMAEGDTFAQTFDEAGTYEYFCDVHPTMRSTVVVG